MEKIKAKYIVPLEETNKSSADIETKGLSFVYTVLDENLEQKIKAEMKNYFLNVFYYYEYEYDDDDGPSKSYNNKDFEIEDLISLTSPVYSTDEVCADIIISEGSFKGLIMKGRNWGGSGWNNYDEWWYIILYADGTILGKNKSTYSFSGSSSSKEEEKTYELIEKK